MNLSSIGSFFKHLGVDIKALVVDVPALEAKFAKAVKSAQEDSAAVITAGKPFISAAATASAAIVAAAAQHGVNWVTDTTAVAAVENTFKQFPAFLAAIEKEGSDVIGDFKS
jgi:diphthamide biosynthesis methyltransferase